MRLTNVLYVPDLRMNLISVSALDKHNVGLIIGQRRCRLCDLKTDEIIGFAKENIDGLYSDDG